MKSIIKSPAARRHLPSKKPLDVRAIRILQVEGNQAVVDAVRDMLESDGWNILLKPKDISAIAETITRLLKTASKRPSIVRPIQDLG